MGNQARHDVPALMQDAHDVQHLTAHAVEHKEGEAIEGPDAQRFVRQEMGVAAQANARMLDQEGQHAQQFVGKGLAKTRRGLVIPVLGRIGVTTRSGT